MLGVPSDNRIDPSTGLLVPRQQILLGMYSPWMGGSIASTGQIWPLGINGGLSQGFEVSDNLINPWGGTAVAYRYVFRPRVSGSFTVIAATASGYVTVAASQLNIACTLAKWATVTGPQVAATQILTMAMSLNLANTHSAIPMWPQNVVNFDLDSNFWYVVNMSPVSANNRFDQGDAVTVGILEITN